MSYNGSLLSSASLAVAGRRAPGGRLASGIFGRKFMPMFAMRPGLLPESICKTAHGKASKINLLVFGKDFARLPAKSKSAVDGIVMQPGFFGPLHNCFGHAFVSYADVAFSVVGLLFSRSPAAIIRAIAFRVINTLKGVAFGPLAHVFFKGGKIIPARTNFYTASAVSIIMRCIRVIAPRPHLQPYAINWGIRFTVFNPHIEVTP